MIFSFLPVRLLVLEQMQGTEEHAERFLSVSVILLMFFAWCFLGRVMTRQTLLPGVPHVYAQDEQR